MPSAASAAARLTVRVDLPTPPLPEPTQRTFSTAASAPLGSPPPRPSFCCSPLFSLSDRTSKATSTRLTPGRARTASATAVWNWLRIGQPGVVSDTVTATAPSGEISIERTMPSSTMDACSSGSMTASRDFMISSREGMASG